MCSGSKSSVGVIMDGDDNTNKQEEGVFRSSYNLLELSAVNDVASFKRAVEEEGHNFDEPSSWYGRRNGSKKLGFEERTPLMIAAMFGSKDVLSYILETRFVDVNRACGSDGATALHCAAASGSCRSYEIVKILIDASADINCIDANGSKPCEVIAISPKMNSKSRRILETLLKGGVDQVVDEEEPVFSVPQLSTESSRPEKKEYPIDPSLPDIKNGICSTDEFRMYSFKVKPCSRAYSHDWTECPFAHPGENARRRDPRKYHYSCVPCPEFRKGSCSKGDACEYAHGVFECWLHPAQYRTRLCKDEINCPRRVCFFAHKLEELRPMYASTGSAVPSPISMSSIGASHFEMPSLSPLALGSSSMLLSSTRTPPITPTSASTSPMWQNQFNSMTPPSLQLPGSRLRPGLNARNVGLEAELLGIEKPRRLQHFEEFAGLSSPSRWNTSLNDAFGYVEPAVVSQSPTGMQIRQNMNQQLRSTYPSSITSSPIEGSSLFSIDPPSAMNSRSAAFAKRSQSFIDRTSAVNRFSGLSSPALASPPMMPSQFPSWGSPGGKLDWGVQGQELDKLRRSASFGFHSTGNTNVAGPDVSWARSIDTNEQLGSEEKLKQMQMYHLNSGGSEMIPPWIEQLYMEQQEQLVA